MFFFHIYSIIVRLTQVLSSTKKILIVVLLTFGYTLLMAKILLAEDDLFLRDIYTEILTGEGFDLSVAVDGDEALKKLLKGQWDLVLLDVVMPKMTGIEILEYIKSKKADKRYAKHILLMTNSDEIRGIKEVKDLLDEILLKSSFTPGELIA